MAVDPYAPPKSPVADRPGDGPELATRGSRLAAAFIDGLIVIALFWALNLLVWGITVSDVEDPSVKTLVLQHLQGVVLYFLVNGYTLYRDGQSLGKKVLRIRIVRGNGEKATFGRILGLRYLPLWAIGIIPVIGSLVGLIDALLIFRDNRRCLYDNIADTMVVVA